MKFGRPRLSWPNFFGPDAGKRDGYPFSYEVLASCNKPEEYAPIVKVKTVSVFSSPFSPNLKALAAFFAINLMISAATADDQPNIPKSSWEQHREGIALAITLTSQTGADDGEHAVHIYIKNTSAIDKKIIDGDIDHGMELYYLNDSGVKVPLHNYHPIQSELEMIERNPKKKDVLIKPNEIVSRSVNINSSDLLLLKTHPVICRFFICDLGTNQQSTIESSPRQLTEIVETPPNK
jgi:hypothetical protein